jgi:hypothetical protein
MKLLETKQIRIGDKEYPAKMSMRAMINFEELSGHSISTVSSLSDITILCFCTIKAGGTEMTYEEFMNLIDDKPEILEAFSEAWMEKTDAKKK